MEAIHMFDYAFLRLLWWLVLGVLLIGIAIMDGFDLGVAILLPFAGRTDMERRIVINTVGPVWEGNQVWLILGGGAIFAAWPPLYAVAFSGFYFAMLLLLCSLILRPVGFKFRSKIEAPAWRSIWDGALFLGGLVPALVYGVAFGNVLQGVPFRFDDTLRLTYEGSFWALFNPFALLCGLVSVSMLAMHGAAYLACKTQGAPSERARDAGTIAAIVLLVLFVAAGLWASRINFYAITQFGGMDGPSNPLLKQVERVPGALMTNYATYPWMIAAPLLGILGAIASLMLTRVGRRPVLAFVSSGLSVAGVIATAGCSLFPFLLPSSLEPNAGLTVWDASSSRLTLAVMTAVTVLLLPIVLAYTAWVYHVLRGPVTAEQIEADQHTAY
jgi:cytochrome bd ubiquinol oxidase subunit II